MLVISHANCPSALPRGPGGRGPGSKGKTVGGGPGAAPAPPARVLVVEDDYLVATEIEAELTDAGYEVVGIASTARDALALARARRPALVIMDVGLSGTRDGIDAALEIYRESGTRCIFASAHRDPETLRRAEPARPIAWLAKPFDGSVLIRVLREALDPGRKPH